MAYTTIDQLKKDALGKMIQSQADPDFRTLYYEIDLEIVRRQDGFQEFKNFYVVFERQDSNVKDIMVKAGINSEGEMLEKVALPWPPYYHDEQINFAPGSLLLADFDASLEP